MKLFFFEKKNSSQHLCEVVGETVREAVVKQELVVALKITGMHVQAVVVGIT